MSIELLTVLLFGCMFLLLFLGQPVAFALAGLATLFTLLLWSPDALSVIPLNVWRQMSSFALIAIPLFIFMANVLQKSAIADDLYEMMYRWFGPLRGGLAAGTVIICTIFAAMSGTSAAGTVTMGLVALPSMLRRGYNKSLAIGCISAGGALGVLIPPSIIMIFLGLMTDLSIGKLFAGGVFPGLLYSGLFVVYILVRSFIQPKLAPALPPEQRASMSEKIASLKSVILPAFLVLAVLGSIFSGMATPSEAAGIGALGGIVCAGIKRRLTWQSLKEASYDTLQLTGMIVWILFGAVCFAVIYTAVGAQDFVKVILMKLPGGRWGILVGMLFSYIILGCVLDAFGIIAITAPLYFPIVKSLGFDPLWFGILYMLTYEMGALTPPFGLNLFMMRGVVPRDTSMGEIIKSIWPFVALQLIGLVIVVEFPQMTTWLPKLIFG